MENDDRAGAYIESEPVQKESIVEVVQNSN